MNLRDYLSDSAEVNAQIKDLDRAKSCELKVLGIKWKADDDTLIMECADKEQIKVTKRSVLSQINGFCFDPLGLLTPLMISAKIFLQDIHKQKLGWDTILPDEQIQRWKAIKEDIAGFKKAIPRTVLNKTPEAKYMLSVFVDSSKRAYACCLYTTTSTKNGTKNTSLFTARAKVAPIKKGQTIPRLELLWWKGPTWLSYPDEEWPVRPISDVKDIDDDECEMLIQHTTEDLNKSDSDWPIDTIADEDQVTSRLPNAAEIILAEKQIVLQEQRIHGTALVSKNKQFKTVFDSDGILRKCGRIQRAEIQSEIANPMYIPKQSILGLRIAEHIHRDLAHCGNNQLLCELRQRFWIP
ncbi:unnamed protein product [Cylicocyclus nassatus]|uniref:Uncharacterized protein n=1 Tax=Cylicocyclus nassatus TaxID=53992 RepID=A0AA36DSI0_CYLNA|nr:unnamed protein product [Cylicocyclus nassatus]